MKKKKHTPVFKPYDQNVLPLIPPSWDEFISENHPVRVVNNVINRINIDNLLSEYEGGGRSPYHPKMLLKLIVYGYLCNIYSSRKLEAFAGENIHCMWLTSLQRPDHNTINRFRSERLRKPLKEIFSQVVRLLMESGHVSLRDVYVDGTKIEANANKYTFVWGKAIKGYKEKIGSQLEYLWTYAEAVAKEEMSVNETPDFGKVEPGMVRQTVEAIDAALKDKAVDKHVKQKLGYGKKHWEENVEKYEEQETILGKRNSYSKTDPEATFMRMKEDHMLNGQLKAGYNVQISTNNQIVVDYSIHQRPTDTTTLVSHVEGMIDAYGERPENLIADAGYGSEENYRYMEDKGIKAYVKYNTFDKEKKAANRKPFGVESLHYNKELDCYYCPMGQPMQFIGERNRKTATGYVQQSRLYQAVNCQGCPLRGVCHSGQSQRVIEINERVNHYRKQAESILSSEQGIAFRKKRCYEVEPVFGNMKQNKGFRRFLLRGIAKVGVETGLVYLAHNLKRAWKLGFTMQAPIPA
jgi:transposase